MKIIEDCAVKEILTEKQRAGQYDRVTGAVTSKGLIKCDIFINCTGMVIYLLSYLIYQLYMASVLIYLSGLVKLGMPLALL